MLVTYFVLRMLSTSNNPSNENSGPVRQAEPLTLPRAVTVMASSQSSGVCPNLIRNKSPLMENFARVKPSFVVKLLGYDIASRAAS